MITDVQAEAILILFAAGMDSADIAHATTLPEPVVVRFLHGYRGTVRELYREARA